MGYYARANGRLILNEYGKEHREEILMMLKNNRPLLEDAFDKTELHTDSIELLLSDNYHEDETIEVLKCIYPYIQNGESIEYLGEDGSEWRFLRSEQGWEDQAPTHVWETEHIHKIK